MEVYFFTLRGNTAGAFATLSPHKSYQIKYHIYISMFEMVRTFFISFSKTGANAGRSRARVGAVAWVRVGVGVGVGVRVRVRVGRRPLAI